jgi:hypothetical protein
VKTLDQIRRSHASARPKHDNPAWLHTHSDLTFVLEQLDEALAFIRGVVNDEHGDMLFIRANEVLAKAEAKR